MNNQQNKQQNTNLTEQISSTANQPEPTESVTKNTQKKKTTLKLLCIIIGIIATLLVLCVCTVLALNYLGKNAMHDYADMTIAPEIGQIGKVDTVDNSSKTIQYKGSTYAFNENVTSIVLMGIDNDDLSSNKKVVGCGGQADAVYIAAIDTKNHKVTILGVSRDTMIDVDVYNQEGGFVHTAPMQLCLSYAYGDGAHTSCENTIKSLERLFYGLQFDTYFSINENALETLCDLVGGVKITLDSDFYSEYYARTFYKGESLTLHGKDALNYIRARNIEKLDSNNDRMARQRVFMSAFVTQTFNSIKSNPSAVSELYSAVKDNTTTNLTPSKLTYLTSTAITELNSYKDVEFVNITGTVKNGEYAEFYVDEDSLFELMLDIFYTKVE